MGFRIQGLGFKVLGTDFRVEGLGFRELEEKTKVWSATPYFPRLGIVLKVPLGLKGQIKGRIRNIFSMMAILGTGILINHHILRGSART